MRRLDLPPVWGAGFAILAWWWAGAVDLLAVGEGARTFGWALLAVGVGWAVWAVATMARADTPIEPRRTPRALVTAGPFRLVRHPIYRGLVWGLAGWTLATGEATGLVLAPVYALVLLRRFVEPEERALAAIFPDAFRDWAARVRWRL